MSKSTQISSKDSKTKKDKVTKQKDTKADGDEGEEITTKTMVSSFVPQLNARKEEYDEIWRNKNESHNPQQFHYMDIIEHQQMIDMENGLRKVVDEMMKGELLLLQVHFFFTYLPKYYHIVPPESRSMFLYFVVHTKV
jgi:hypothetical protein